MDPESDDLFPTLIGLDYCIGFSYSTDCFDFTVNLMVDVMECNFGIFSFLFYDYSDCYWKNYQIETPIFEYNISDALDMKGDLLELTCSYNQIDPSPLFPSKTN